MNIDDLKVGHKVNITTKAYQVNYNKSLKMHSFKNKKKYTDDEYKRDVANGRKTRPIVIIQNRKEQDYFIAVSESNSRSDSQIKHNYKNKNNTIWKFELLILEKKKVKLIPTGKSDEFIWDHYSENEISNFLKSFKDRKREIFKALDLLM